jgi:hypothetical protein
VIGTTFNTERHGRGFPIAFRIVKRQPRKYCEPVRQLDIRVFQRKRLLDAGGSIVVRWQIGGSMRVALSPHRARVVYQLDGRFVEQSINIADTANGYGRRGWWGCPGCGRLCAKLYLHDRFLCRRCAGLHYESQSAAPRRRPATLPEDPIPADG